MHKTGSPHCSSSLKGGVPISTDRGQWRSHYREPADVFLPTCGHHFPWLHYTGLPSGGFFSQGSTACCWLKNPGMMTNTSRMYYQIRKEEVVCCILYNTVVCLCWGHENKIASSLLPVKGEYTQKLYLLFSSITLCSSHKMNKPIHCYKDSNELCNLIRDIRSTKY